MAEFQLPHEKEMSEKKYLDQIKQLEEETINRLYLVDIIAEEFRTLIHDLKSPLTVIIGYADITLNKKGLNDVKKEEFLKRIIQESERLLKMIKFFLNTLSEERNLNKLELNKINIEEILKYFYNIYEVKAHEKNIRYELQINHHLPDINGNYAKLEFVVSNLFSNAFKYVVENGGIRIKAGVKNSYLHVDITSTSPEILDIDKERIFEKYNRGTSSHPGEDGTGLGLYISKMIIDRHHGNIGVINDHKEGGTTFYFEIPLYDQ